MSVIPGIERFVAHPPGESIGVRLGLLTNPSGIDRQLRSSVDIIAQHPDLDLVALYGPEHGVRGDAQAGEHVSSSVDQATGLPVFSLYDDATNSQPDDPLDTIDVLLFDIQDIGVRYATYLSTLDNVLEACAEHDVRVIVLDRPNPLGGTIVAGNMLEPTFRSFVGTHSIPVMHGLTMGEFARLWARDHGKPEPLVVSMEGWNREMWFDQTGLQWVLPSPNLPTLDSVALYPATCLIEGTTLSEGRGTARPFELIGAPRIEPTRLAAELTSLGIAGVDFRPVFFTPTFSKHQGERCAGVQIYLQSRGALDAVALGPVLLATIKKLYPDQFCWLPPRGDEFFIDKLAGSSALRLTVDQEASLSELLHQWALDSARFVGERSDILLY